MGVLPDLEFESEEKTRSRRSVDAELRAMDRCLVELEELSPAAQARCLFWLGSRMAPPVPMYPGSPIG